MTEVAIDDRAWRLAHIHAAAHGSYAERHECPACIRDLQESPFTHFTHMAQDRITLADWFAIDDRARALNAQVGAIFSSRHGWITTAETPERRIGLRGHGPLVAVLAGLLDDLEQSE